MNLNTVSAVCFSPTRTTRKVITAVCRGIGISHRLEDLTFADSDLVKTGRVQADLAVVGVPVYSGRIPLKAKERLQAVRADNVPAVAVVVYGNRDYDDALIELADTLRACGFRPFSGAAFIGEHSFSSDRTLIADGRPDATDLGKSHSFGEQIRALLDTVDRIEDIPEIAVPGNRPYKEKKPMPPVSPVTKKELCVLCGRCVSVCPTTAIKISSASVETGTENCICCAACVKACPHGARIFDHPRILSAAEKLSRNCSRRREPEIFPPSC